MKCSDMTEGNGDAGYHRTHAETGCSRQTLANWMLQATNTWLQPLYNRMRTHALAKAVLHADETTLQVLREDGRAAETQSYMWLYRTGREGPPIVLYDYQRTRGVSIHATSWPGSTGTSMSTGARGTTRWLA